MLFVPLFEDYRTKTPMFSCGLLGAEQKVWTNTDRQRYDPKFKISMARKWEEQIPERNVPTVPMVTVYTKI